MRFGLFISLFVTLCSVALAQNPPSEDDECAAYIRAHYTKVECRVPMRDGVHLFTTVYTPNASNSSYPILLFRTPYSCRPYGADQYRGNLGPHHQYAKDGYIFVYQDVRGKYMSEGTFVNMRPHCARKKSLEESGGSAADVDESSDAYDTIEWLLANLKGHNGRVGQWGISYPGFYAAAAMIDSHPALRAVSPQAPIADWFFDDFHHHGAFFLPHGFNFLAGFGKPRPEPTTESSPDFEHGTPDGYQFFLELGPLVNANEKHLHGEVAFWNEIVAHPNYDEFWQARSILPHLRNVKCAVLTVGGWFDAENLYGPLKIYREVEANNPGIFNALVMGPWHHGGWARSDGSRLGNADFGFPTSEYYRENIEWPFFRHHLKGEADPAIREAHVFETGANRWRAFDAWPPTETETKSLYLHGEGQLTWSAPETDEEVFDDFLSDPKHPVPFTETIANGMTREYMTDDQRFAARRPDVLTYRTAQLESDLTIAGPILAELFVSTSESAADWIVKLIDVHPPDLKDPNPNPTGFRRGGYQMLVRSEVIRGRFRNSYEHPEPFVPNQVAEIELELLDVLHTFKRGHCIMVQIQSTWFPLVDRNPQRYVPNIFLATEDDFVRAWHRVYRSKQHATRLRVGVLPGPLDSVGR